MNYGILGSVAPQLLVPDKGNIRRPDRVRDTFPSLGAVWVNGTPEGEMHLVWASPGTAAAYRLDNRFADGAVLVKEVLAGEHGRMTTGQAKWASDCQESLVRHDQGRTGAVPWESALGRRLGVGALQRRCAGPAGRYGLSEGLFRVPLARARHRLGLRQELFGADARMNKEHVGSQQAIDRFRTKRIYERPDSCDGTRILVGRLWPRGVTKGRASGARKTCCRRREN